MRISDWISDVCSSDLTGFSYRKLSNRTRSAGGAIATKRLIRKARNRNCGRPSRSAGANSPDRVEIGPVAVDRKSVVSGKSVSVRVDLGVPRIIQKNTNANQGRITTKRLSQ